MQQIIKIHPSDNVIVCLQSVTANQSIDVDDTQIIVSQDLDRGSKIAITDIPQGSDIKKYGGIIGIATRDIFCGDWIHTHNMKTKLSETLEYQYEPNFSSVETDISQHRYFQGYERADGNVGVRNEIWVIPTVGCVNGIAKKAINLFLEKHSNLQCDGIHLFAHNYGCSQLGEDHNNTKNVLANMVTHPNAGGALVIGLGCENNQIIPFMDRVGEVDSNRVHYMVAQQEHNEIEAAVEHLEQIYNKVKMDQRTPVNLSKLKIGLECGGSDGLSGITANPLIGKFSDYLIAEGGTSVLTEVPEMFGAEHLLFERCINEEVFNKAVAMINGFKEYFIAHNQPIYENPSPGNKKGGISSLEDKSMGCTQKAGSSPVIDVLKYGEKLKLPGLNLLSAPGNDAVATSALATSGCQIVLFSTGRGTPYGGIVPTLKIATNSALSDQKPHWIDFNAGVLVEDTSMKKLLELFVDKIIAVASGELTCNEINDIRELAIFKSGVTL